MGMESNRNQIANPHSHTHCQAAQAYAKTQAWRQRVSVPTHPKTDRKTNGRRRTTKAQHHLYASRGFVLRRTGKCYI